MVNLFFTGVPKQLNREKIVFSTNIAETRRCIGRKKITSRFTFIIHVSLKWIMVLDTETNH